MEVSELSPLVKRRRVLSLQVVSEKDGLGPDTAEGGCSAMTPRRLPPLDDGTQATGEAQEEPLPPITSDSGAGPDEADAGVGTEETAVGTEDTGVGPDPPSDVNKTDADKTQV